MDAPATQSGTDAARLRTALEATAEALARPSIEGLLAAETALKDATARLTTLTMMSTAERVAVRDDLFAAWSALVRCRQLGASLEDFVRVSLDARGQGTGYDGPTDAAAGSLAGRGFQTTA